MSTLPSSSSSPAPQVEEKSDLQIVENDKKVPSSSTTTAERSTTTTSLSSHPPQNGNIQLLPPFGLTVAVLVCSGFLFVFGLRDFLTTGRNIGGTWDEAMLIFTKSTDWYEDAKGWKSTMGGFSAIQSTTTDLNNMGGFFIRKLSGAATLAVHLHKLLPFFWYGEHQQWPRDYRIFLHTAILSNMALAAFYGVYWDDLEAAGASQLPTMFLVALFAESAVMLAYLFASLKTYQQRCKVSVALPHGKTPNSFVSNIVTRTTLLCTTAIAVLAGRDLFFPGQIIKIIPRDDIYLEWTNAFWHSPPDGTPEAEEHTITAPLYIGDKFVSQYAALCLLILCLYKYVAALMIRYGADGSGVPAARMIWKSAFLGEVCIMLCWRFFAHAAQSASFDVRWHLVVLSFETCIVGLYGFF